MKLTPGTALNDRYRIVSEIGAGGSAIVYLGRNVLLDSDVAIKVLNIGFSEKNFARFQREARLMAQLRHPNLVSIFSFDLYQGTPFIVMEYLQGQSLHRLLSEQGSLDFSLIRDIFLQICSGLAYAHEAGVVHCDLSPSNIFIANSGGGPNVKILDFGISKLLAGEDAGETVSSGNFVGTPHYMSPERAAGRGVDERSDIYSLGSVLYECLSGKKIFADLAGMQLVYAQQHEYPREPISNKVRDPSDLWLLRHIALLCLQKEPAKRFQNARAVSQCLETGVVPAALLKNVQPWSNTLSTPGSEQEREGTGKRILLLCTLLFGLLLSSVAFLFAFPGLVFSAAQPLCVRNVQCGIALTDLAVTAFGVRHDFDSILACRVKEFQLMGPQASAVGLPAQIIEIARKTSDKQANAALVFQCLATLDNLLHAGLIDREKYIDYQFGLLDALVKLKSATNGELRQGFSSFLKSVALRSAEYSDADFKKYGALLTDLLKRLSPCRFSESETDDLLALPSDRMTDKGISFLNALGAADKSNPLIRFRQIILFSLNGRDYDAIKACESMMDEPPNDGVSKARVAATEAFIYLGLGQAQNALRVCERGAATFGPNTADLDFNKVQLECAKMKVLFHMGRYGEVHSIASRLTKSVMEGQPVPLSAIYDRTAANRRAYLESLWIVLYTSLLQVKEADFSRALLKRLLLLVENEKWREDDKKLLTSLQIAQKESPPESKETLRKIIALMFAAN